MVRFFVPALSAILVLLASPNLAAANADPAAKAASPGNPDATPGTDVTELGRQWLSGQSAARSRLEALAADGRTDAQEMLGEVLHFAMRDDVTACRWFAKSATARSDGLHNLALCYENGEGIARDLAKAAALYGQAAGRGYAKSMCALGNLTIAGKGVPKDEAKGAALCRQGAELGERDAQTDLGNLFLRGVGVPKDIVKARHWYELAAAQGQPNAQFVLGQIYWNGNGVERSQTKAAEFLEQAFKGGRRDAAPILAKWLFAGWMSEHVRGDLTRLDAAIGYQKIALSSAAEKSRADEQAVLDLMQATRSAAEKEKL